MCSGRDSYHTHKVSCSLDSVEWSYKHLIFLAKHSKWRLRYAHTVSPIRTILISFRVTRLKSIHTVFHFIPIKFVGGVCESASHVRFCHFLSPGGGAMSVAEFQHVNVFRVGLLSYT